MWFHIKYEVSDIKVCLPVRPEHIFVLGLTSRRLRWPLATAWDQFQENLEMTSCISRNFWKFYAGPRLEVGNSWFFMLYLMPASWLGEVNPTTNYNIIMSHGSDVILLTTLLRMLCFGGKTLWFEGRFTRVLLYQRVPMQYH